MKSLFKIFILAIFPVLLASCNDDEDSITTYISLGKIQETNDVASIALDNGKTLIPSYPISNLEDGERVVVTFSYDEVNEEDEVFEGDIYKIEDVLTKDVVLLTPENEEELGDNAIHVHEEDIWVAGGYLNIYFEYLGSGGVSHFINMAIDGENKYDENGRLILTFKHNAYNDYMNYWFPGIVSFDMESLQEGSEESIDFVVRIKDYDQIILEWEDTYEFGATTTSIHSIKEIPDSSNLK